MNVIKRAKAPTPKFFRVLRSIGLALLAISGTVVAAPVAILAADKICGSYISNTNDADYCSLPALAMRGITAFLI